MNNIGWVDTIIPFEELTDELWYRAFEFNVMTTVRFCREAIPWLEQSKHANIVNIASMSAKQVGAWNYHYCAAKAAQVNLSSGLSRHLGKKGIRVNAVCPSTVKGEGMWERDVPDSARIRGTSLEEAAVHIEKKVRAKTSLNAICVPEDVAEFVAFLVSDRARFITGTAVSIDGGGTRSVF